MLSFYDTNIFVSSYFAVHYSIGSLNSLFGSMRGMDGIVHFQFKGNPHFLVTGAHRSEMRWSLPLINALWGVYWPLLHMRTTTRWFFESQPSCLGMWLLTLIDNYSLGRINGSSRSEGISTTFPMSKHHFPLILLIGDHNVEDGLACGPDHGLGACGHLDVLRL